MLESASVGAFLNITGPEPQRWRQDLSALDELAVSHLELWLEYMPARSELVELVGLLRGRRTIMHGPFIGMSLGTDWEALAAISLDRCRRAIEVAGLIGCEVLTLHAGQHGSFDDRLLAIERVAERLAPFGRLNRPIIAVENMPIRTGASAETLTRAEDISALATCAGELRLTLDVGHCLQNREDPVLVFERFKDNIHNIHLHDGTAGGSAHKALGVGELDLPAFLQALEASHYDRFLSIETLSHADLSASLDALTAAGATPRAPIQHAA